MKTRTADHGGRVSVRAHDGVRLAARIHGPADAPLTVVFVHGHCLRGDSWAPLRRHLASTWGEEVRLVTYDQRGHGDSGRAPAETYTIDQLGSDLDAVIDAVAPTGRLVLVGHSMGGMATLAYGRTHAASIGSRVVGVALIATAAWGLTDMGLGRLLLARPVAYLQAVARVAPAMLHRSRRFGHVVSRAAARRMSGRSAERVSAVARALADSTSVVTMVSFLQSFIEFDERETLAELAHIPALVLCGTEDPMTPFEHSLAMAARLPLAELVSVNGGGHSVILDRADEVASAVSALLSRTNTDALTGRVG
ncbi:alpha/beta fold hydrolase [Rhodococcus sp. NPDC058521]|uniref:alpha/beta fold hydrolase n=1 Tax=Rhodococcus sp. NPDC058521 TaxID=3346536 RepID=UPI003664E7D2